MVILDCTINYNHKIGILVGLVVGTMVMYYQSSLLDQELLQLERERMMYLQMGKVMTNQTMTGLKTCIQECQAEVGDQAQKQEEEFKQLERVKEGLLLDKDILNQLKVKNKDQAIGFYLWIAF